jgi:hypothetical protein
LILVAGALMLVDLGSLMQQSSQLLDSCDVLGAGCGMMADVISSFD